MAVLNYTVEGGKWKTFELLCSAGSTTQIRYHLTCLAVLNVFLAVSAILGNTLILAALNRMSSLHPPSKVLFRNLAATDLCVGLIAEPLHVAYEIIILNERWDICHYVLDSSFVVGSTLGAVSLLTMTAISVDRLLALLLGLRYRQVVTVKRTYLVVIAFWIASPIGTTMYFLSYLITLKFTYIVVSVCLITSIFSYTRIFLTLRHHRTQVQCHAHQQQLSQTFPLNIARYRRAVYSALWVQLLLVVCYLPYGIVAALWTYTGISSVVFFAAQCTIALVYLNSSLNPVIYCWKIKEVRQAVKDTIRQFFSSS